MAEAFWKKGIRFECQGTGRCCVSRGAYGFVYLSLSDRQRLARHFKLPTRTFTSRYCEKTDGHFRLKEISADCRFLKGKQCGVYKARPTQCRTWPFWPEHMTPKAWAKEVASFCPGVGKGRLVDGKEIAELMRQDSLIWE